jgi:hypothetical protein
MPMATLATSSSNAGKTLVRPAKLYLTATSLFPSSENREGGRCSASTKRTLPALNPSLIKCSGGEHDFYLGHCEGEMKLIHRSEVNHENSYWRIGYHEE